MPKHVRQAAMALVAAGNHPNVVDDICDPMDRCADAGLVAAYAHAVQREPHLSVAIRAAKMALALDKVRGEIDDVTWELADLLVMGVAKASWEVAGRSTALAAEGRLHDAFKTLMED